MLTFDPSEHPFPETHRLLLGGAATFNAGTVVPNPNYTYFVNNQSGITATYSGHNVGIPTGALWVTVSGTNVTVESSAANDNNTVQITIMTP